MTANKHSANTAKADGRLMRSERSREAIIKAMLELIEEGNLTPTAQQTADRAGVGIRSVFRHFEDMETVFTRADELMRPRFEEAFSDTERSGSLSKRIFQAVQTRAAVYESFKHVILSMKTRLWRSRVLQKNYAREQRRLRKDLQDWLPEVKKLPDTQRQAIDAITSFENWNRLRQHQGLSEKKSTEVIIETVSRLIR